MKITVSSGEVELTYDSAYPDNVIMETYLYSMRIEDLQKALKMIELIKMETEDE